MPDGAASQGFSRRAGTDFSINTPNKFIGKANLSDLIFVHNESSSFPQSVQPALLVMI